MTTQKLYRSRSDRMIFGICGGLGHYFGIDTTIVRLFFVLGCIFIVRWVGKKFLGLQSTASGSGPVQILCRIPIAPRQQLLLLQIGRRRSTRSADWPFLFHLGRSILENEPSTLETVRKRLSRWEINNLDML